LRSSDSDIRLDERALEHLGKSDTTSVRDLYQDLRTSDPTLTESEVTAMVWRLSKQNKATLEDAWPVTRSFPKFLALWERHLPVYSSLATALAAILSVYVVPSDLPWLAIRWVFASLFVLFIPGFVTVETLFPRGSELNSLERFALSVGLSLAIVTFVGFLLNISPWGIRLAPLVVSLTIICFGLAIGSLVTEYSKQNLPSFRK